MQRGSSILLLHNVHSWQTNKSVKILKYSSSNLCISRATVYNITYILARTSLLFLPLPRYTMAAQDLVMRARGVLRDRGWRITNERLGSGDDISVFIIPLMYGNRQP